jgi:hypothetical protein
VDCVDILTLLDVGGSDPERFELLKANVYKGFVVVESRHDIDVVAVYTLKNVERLTVTTDE